MNQSTDIWQRISDLLDQVLVRAENGYAVQQELTRMAVELDGTEWKSLLARAQGCVGLVNASRPGDPMRDEAFQQVSALKQELRG